MKFKLWSAQNITNKIIYIDTDTDIDVDIDIDIDIDTDI